MTKNPYSVEENTLASEILIQMNKKKLLVHLFIKKETKEILLEFYISTIF